MAAAASASSRPRIVEVKRCSLSKMGSVSKFQEQATLDVLRRPVPHASENPG